MNKSTKILIEIALVLVSLGLIWLIVSSIMKPVKFNEQKDYRSELAIQRLKDIRTLQVAFKAENGRFVSSIDSLKDFYLNGKMVINMQVGSEDDSVAVANTAKFRRQGYNDEKLYQLYKDGERNLVFKINGEINVRDSLFLSRTDFNIDSLAFIPFSGGDSIVMRAVIKPVSGVNVPLFEACMPYWQLLKGLDEQEIINLRAEREKQDKFDGLMVGSINSPNNNAGNWE